MVKLEKQHVSVNSSSYVSQHSITSSISMSGNNSTGQMSYNSLRTFNQATGETSGVVNSYLLFHTTSGDDSGTVTFDGEIIGIFWDVSYIHSNLNSSTNSSSNASTVRSLYNNSSLSYETNALPGLVMENNGTGTGNSYTYRYGNSSNTNYDNDRVAVTSSGGTNNKLHMRVSDGNGGDYIRVIVKVNVDPSAVADTGYIQEGKTLTVANSGSAVAGTTTGRNTGDITDNDTDANNDSLTVTHIQHSGAGSSTSVTNVTYNHGSATSVSGTYGTLTIGSDGSYQYVASSDINNLDAGEANITDVFTYTVSDGNGGTDTETLTINVIPSQDLTARNDTGTVNEDATLEVDDGDDLTTVAAASYDDSDSLTIAGSNSSPVTTQSHFEDLIFNDDGTKMYTLGYASSVSGKNIFQYTLSVPFDVSTASVSSDDYINVGGSWTTDNEAIRFNNDGTKLFVLYDATTQNHRSTIYQYTLSTPYDITSTVTEGVYYRIGDLMDDFRSFLFNDDGSKMFISRYGIINEYTLSISFDTSTASKTTAAWWSSNNSYGISNYGSSSSITGMQYNNDGTKLFTVHQKSTIGHTAKIVEWSLSTAYNPMTASTNADFNDTSTYFETGEATSSAGNGIPTQFITFNNDGTKFFSFNHTHETGSSSSQKIKEWNLASPFNLVNVSGEHSGDVINTSSTDNYDTDPDSDTLTVTAIRTGSSEGSGTAGSIDSALTGTYGQLTIAANGSYTYVANQDAADALDPGDVVTDTFNYTVSDGQGETDIAVLTITVNGINDAPVADAETGSVNISQTLTVTDGTSDLLHGDTDADASASLSVSSIVATTASGSATAVNPGTAYNSGYTSVTGSKGTLRVGADGTYQYIAGSSAGTDVFTYTLSDGTATHTATLTITVSGNNAPTAVNDTDAVNEDATITESSGSELLVADDSDADDDSFTVTQIGVTGGSNSAVSSGTNQSNGTSITGTLGTLVVGANGSYTYVADQSAADDLDASDTATDSFTYTISDGTATDTATLIITVTGVNDVPTASDKTITTNEDTAHVFSASDFGYTDADDDDALVSVKITGLEDAGALEYYNGSAWVDVTENQVITATDIAANNLRFNPAANENGSSYTTFDFTVNDGDADSASANTITVNVTAVNDAPVADDETNSVNEDATVTVTDGTSDVLHGDTDADSDNLTVTQIGVTDGSNSSVASSSSYNSNGRSVTGTYGTLTIGADGTYTYVADQSASDDLDASDTATDSFTYTVSDGTATDTATLIFTVTGINDAPAAVNDTDAVNEDATVTRTSGDNLLMADDSDADDDDSFTVTQIGVTGGSNSSVAGSSTYNNNFTSVTGTYGTLKVGADGTYTYVADQSAADDLDASDTATDSFTYTISDGTATDTATLIFTVTGINDAPAAVNDTDAVNEDATVTRTSGDNLLMADDSDADDDDSFTVTQIGVTGGSNSAVSSGTNQSNGTSITGTLGTLVIGANGSYTYVADQSAADDLDASDTATDSFTYTISDGTATDTATLIITVTGVNDVPTASDKTITTNEDTAHVFSASDFGYTDADDDDALVSVKITGLEDAGALEYYNGSAWVDVTENQVITATDIAANNLRFNPAANENGSSYTTFDFTVNDGDADSASANTITVNVTAVNDAPVADDETNSVNEDATVTVTDGTSDVLHGDTDADSDNLTVTQIGVTDGSNSSVASSSSYNSNGRSVTGTYGTLTIGADGTYTYVADQSASDDLDASDTATDSFTYTVSDGTATDTATLIFTVTGINDAPAAVNDTDAVNEDATVTRTSGDNLLMADDSDADDDDSFTVTQIGVTGGSNSSVAGSSTYNNNFTSVTGTYGTLKVGADGTYTYVADQSAADDLDASDTATDSFTYTISDGTATDTATLIFTVTGINDAPAAVNDTDAVNEDATVTRTSGDNLLMADDSDADDDDSFTVTQIGVTGGSNSAVSSGTNQSNGTSITGTLGTLVIGANGSYTYVADQSAADDLDASDTATDSFTYTISDGTATDTATLIITVTGVNDVPTASDKTITTNEDTAHVFSASDFGYTDADDDDALVSVKITGLEDAGALEYYNGSAWVDVTENQVITATDIAANNLRFNPAANENGSSYTTFDFTVNDGDADSASANTITVNVTAVNDAPVADDETNSVNEDATVTVTDGTSDVLHGDTDADSDNLTVTQIGVTDGSNSSVASSSSYNSNGRSVTGTYGTLTIGADGTYTYVADQSASDDLDASDTATDSFTYTVSDGTATDTATLIFTVTGINDAPAAVNDTDAVNEDATVTRTSGDNLLMADDSDADDDDSFTVTQIGVTGGSNSAVSSGTNQSNGTSITGTLGTLVIGANGSYTYVADQSAADDLDASDTATDSFTYTISDGTATDTATLIITVTGVNDVPTASDKTITTNEDTAHVFSASDFGYTDADDDDALVSVKITGLEDAGALEYYNGSAWVDVTENQVITATDIAANNLRFNPAANENGSSYTTFDFTVNDGDADSASANTITVNVTAVNDAPVADDETNSVNEDATVTVTDGTSDVLHGDTDADSDNLTVTQIGVTDGSNSSVASSSSYNSNGRSVTGTYGTLTIGADGTYTYVADQSASDDLDASDTATDSFTYTVSDGTATDTATLIFTVTGINDAPAAVNDTDAVNEDATVTRTSGDNLLMADDSDADDDDSFTVTQIGVTGGSNSSVAGSSTYNNNFTSVTGTYGTLKVGAEWYLILMWLTKVLLMI